MFLYGAMNAETSDKEQTNAPDAGASAPDQAKADSGRAKKLAARFTERQSKDLAFYLAMAVIFVELLITLVALCYGIVTARTPAGGGMPQFNFPWIAYLVALVTAPAVLLLMVHLTGVGLFRTLRGHEEDDAWQEKLPERLRRAYALIQGAPVVVLLLGVILLGALLFFVDGALGMLLRVGQSIEQYLPWILGGTALIACVSVIARAWFRHRSDAVAEEYAFRREVLEKTGVIIVDKGSIPLPPGEFTRRDALPAGAARALPEARDIQVLDILPAGPSGDPAGDGGNARSEKPAEGT